MQQLEILHIRKGELRMYQAIIIDDEQWVIKSLKLLENFMMAFLLFPTSRNTSRIWPLLMFSCLE